VAGDAAGVVVVEEGNVEDAGSGVECVAVAVAAPAAVADEGVEGIEHAVEDIERAAEYVEGVDVGAEDARTDHKFLASVVEVEVALPIHWRGTAHKTTEEVQQVVVHDYVEAEQHDEMEAVAAAVAERNNAAEEGVHDVARTRGGVYEDEVGEAGVVRDAESVEEVEEVRVDVANATAEVVVEVDVGCAVRGTVGAVDVDAARMYDWDNVHYDAHMPE
jgi:hypothetical protein